MITVDCSDALAIKNKLLVHVADKLKALPILKSDKFLLESLDETQSIDKLDVVSAIVEFHPEIQVEIFRLSQKVIKSKLNR